jgi:hypothetical protein
MASNPNAVPMTSFADKAFFVFSLVKLTVAIRHASIIMNEAVPSSEKVVDTVKVGSIMFTAFLYTALR